MSAFVTVVSGLPRSGTSLMMQMLAAGGMPVLTDGVRVPDLDNPRGYLEFEAVKQTRTDSSWVAAAVGKAVKMVYLLLPDLPAAYHYRVILMQRDMREVLASQRAMLLHSGRKGAGLSDEQMADIFDRQIRRMRAWLESRHNFEVITVDYHDCLRVPSAVAGNVNAFLGGDLGELPMAAIADPSLYRQVRIH